MAKIRFLHSNSCRVNQRTQFVLFTRNWAMNYVAAERNCQKKPHLPPCSENSNSHPISAVSSSLREPFLQVKPVLTHLPQPEISVLFAFPENWQTWRWRAPEKDAGSGQCGKRPSQ